jgi:hypothetical protein
MTSRRMEVDMGADESKIRKEWEAHYQQMANQQIEEAEKRLKIEMEATIAREREKAKREVVPGPPIDSDVLLRKLVDALSNAPRKGVVAPPGYFDGTFADYKRFRRQVQEYIRDRPSTFDYNDRKKISFTLSYMNEKAAGQWADNYTRKLQQREANGDDIPSWEAFLEELDEVYTDMMEKPEAQRQLDRLKQGNMTGDEFFQKFDHLRLLAGWNEGNDEHLINLLQQNFRRDIGEQITMISNPTTYIEWKKIAIKMDSLKRSYQATNQQSYRYPNQKSSGAKMTSGSSTTPHQTSGTVYGGRGQPMDIDRTRKKAGCYRCGEEGHIVKDCPMSREGLVCFTCGKPGHIKKACRGGGKQQAREVETSPPAHHLNTLKEAWKEIDDEGKKAWLREMLQPMDSKKEIEEGLKD